MSNSQSISAFFEQHFRTPGQCRLGVWTATSLGNIPVDERVAQDAGFEPGTTMYGYADKLIEYAASRGWRDELEAMLREDLRDAFLNRATRTPSFRYLRARNFRGTSKDQLNA
jgi:hypothetical protein